MLIQAVFTYKLKWGFKRCYWTSTQFSVVLFGLYMLFYLIRLQALLVGYDFKITEQWKKFLFKRCFE